MGRVLILIGYVQAENSLIVIAHLTKFLKISEELGEGGDGG